MKRKFYSFCILGSVRLGIIFIFLGAFNLLNASEPACEESVEKDANAALISGMINAAPITKYKMNPLSNSLTNRLKSFRFPENATVEITNTYVGIYLNGKVYKAPIESLIRQYDGTLVGHYPTDLYTDGKELYIVINISKPKRNGAVRANSYAIKFDL